MEQVCLFILSLLLIIITIFILGCERTSIEYFELIVDSTAGFYFMPVTNYKQIGVERTPVCSIYANGGRLLFY